MNTTTAVRILAFSLTAVLAITTTARAQVGVSVTPDGQMTAQRPANSGPYNADFFVKNTSGGSDVFDIACSGLVNVTCTGVSQSVVSLAAGDSALVTATYTVGGAGTGELDLTASSQFTFSWDEGYYQVPVVSLPPSNWDVLPLNHDNQAMGRCAAACFAATYAQSTVSYISLDVPRNVTLVYHGDHVWPKPFVHLNVQKPSGTPDTVWLQVKKAGVPQAFVNGETLLKFTPATSGWQRIGGQLRDSTWATGMYDVDIVVTWHYAGGSTTPQSWTTKLLVVNEKASTIGRGWTLAGVQRAYHQADSSLLITEGDGSAVFFRKSGSAFTAPAGEFSSVTVNGKGWKRLYGDSTRVYFDSAGRLTDVYDRFNNRTQFLYTAGTYRLTTIRDPNSQDLVLAYGTYGLASIRDNITPYRYTNVTVVSDSTLTAIQDPDGVSSTFQYDGSKRLWKLTDRRGSLTTLGYQTISGKATGKLVTVTAPAVPIFGEGTVSPVVTYTSWQPTGVPYTATASSPYAMIRPDTVYGRITDPGGHVLRFTVGRWGQPVSQINALNDTTVTSYDLNGMPIRVVYPTGVKDTIGYNASGLPTFVRAAVKDSATYISYAGWAQPDSMWGYQVPPVRNFIGPNGRVDSTRTWVAGDTTVTRFVYDTRGRIERVTDPAGHLAGRTWYLGTNGNRSRDSLPGNRQTYYTYDTRGRRTNVAEPGVTSHFMTYDLLNRVLKDSIAGMAPTVYAYDSLFLKTVTDPRGQIYRFAYNALGWTTTRTDPANHADTLRYDRDGLLRQWMNRRQQAVTYTYDVGHRITLKFGANTDTTSWGYSANHRIVMAKSPWALDTQFVSTAGRLDSTRTRLGGQAFTQRFRYTTGGRLDSVEVVGGGITFLGRKYFWDAQSGALSTIRLAGAGTTVLATNRDRLLTSTTLPGGDAIARTYTSVHDEAQVSTAATYAAAVNRYLNFDAAGRITRQIDGSGMAGRAFTYDGLGRLTTDSQITHQGSSNPCAEPNIVDENGNLCTYEGIWNTVPSGSVTYTYDAVGNRTDQGGLYGSANRIRQFASCTYVTDSLGDGNVLSRACGSETVLFTWSAESQLTRLIVGSDTLDFRYDAGGRLVRQKRSGAAVHFLLWQGDNLLAEIDSVTGKVAEYSYYPGLDHPHAVITDSTPHFAHVDGIGNVIALTDVAKNVKRTYDFDAWGGLRGGTDSKPFNNADRSRFKGALWLGPQVDVYYMRARWYEPKAGRFLSEDPTGLEGGINLYMYSENDPVNFTDPEGLEVCVDRLSQISEVEDQLNVELTYELRNGQYCITGMRDRGGSAGIQMELQWQLGNLIASRSHFNGVEWSADVQSLLNAQLLPDAVVPLGKCVDRYTSTPLGVGAVLNQSANVIAASKEGYHLGATTSASAWQRSLGNALSNATGARWIRGVGRAAGRVFAAASLIEGVYSWGIIAQCGAGLIE